MQPTGEFTMKTSSYQTQTHFDKETPLPSVTPDDIFA